MEAMGASLLDLNRSFYCANLYENCHVCQVYENTNITDIKALNLFIGMFTFNGENRAAE